MRKLHTIALTGVAALAVAGAALAAGHDMHQVKVALPDGSIARIEYQGDVAPKVSVTPSLHVVPVTWFDPFDPASFDELDRVAEQMDRQANALMRQVHALQSARLRANDTLDLAAFSKLPAGTVSYSFVSTSNGRDGCSRSIQVTSYGAGSQPKIVSNGSGNCDAVDRTPTPVRLNDQNRPLPSAPGFAVTKTAEPSHPTNTV